MDTDKLAEAVNHLVASVEGSQDEIASACRLVFKALGTDGDIVVRLAAKDAAAMITLLTRSKPDFPFPGFILERSARAADAVGAELIAYGLTGETLSQEWIETMGKEEADRLVLLEDFQSKVVH